MSGLAGPADTNRHHICSPAFFLADLQVCHILGYVLFRHLIHSNCNCKPELRASELLRGSDVELGIRCEVQPRDVARHEHAAILAQEPWDGARSCSGKAKRAPINILVNPRGFIRGHDNHPFCGPRIIHMDSSSYLRDIERSGDPRLEPQRPHKHKDPTRVYGVYICV